MEPEPSKPGGDPNVYMAAERTFLAWVRTGIALMGFGFVVARFGLFLSELAATDIVVKAPSTGFSLPVGVLLISLGILVLVVSAIRYRRWLRAIDRGQFRLAFGTAFSFTVVGALALIGLAVAIYLSVL